MPNRNWIIRIQDILDCIAKIHRYTEGMDFETFKDDDRTIDAVIRNFEVIGEAGRYIPEEIKARYPDIPWKEMIGMRNIMIHGYFGVNITILWQTILEDLQPLVPKLNEMLERERNPE